MGCCTSNPNNAVNRYQRRRELMFIFYFIMGFIVIRIWIILIESNDPYVEIGGGVITLLLIIALCLRYRRLRRREQAIRNELGELIDADGIVRQPGLTSEAIDSMRCFVYEKPTEASSIHDTSTTAVAFIEDRPAEAATKLDVANDTLLDSSFACCSICLAEYSNGDRLLELPCGHQYHRDCCREWLLQHVSCPLCKQDVRAMLQALAADGVANPMQQPDGTAESNPRRDIETGILHTTSAAPPRQSLYHSVMGGFFGSSHSSNTRNITNSNSSTGGPHVYDAAVDRGSAADV